MLPVSMMNACKFLLSVEISREGSPEMQTPSRFCGARQRSEGPDRCCGPATKLETHAHAQLNLALGEVRGEAEGRTGRQRRASVHVEGGEAGLEAKERTDLVVDAGVIGAVGDVKTFRRELQSGPFSDFVLPAQAHIEI